MSRAREIADRDLAATELILDADNDTSITADTDDQIDIRIAGADDFQFTANTLTALSGSSIATNTISETTSASGVTIDSVLLKDGNVEPTGSVRIDDSQYLQLGNSYDLQIYHDGSNSYIQDQGTGGLLLLSSFFGIKNADGSEYLAHGEVDGAFYLYHNGVSKLATASDGVAITGDIVLSGSGNGINLGVTSNTDSNTLDDYEEGTFTLSMNGFAFQTNSTGRYIKIGKFVHFTAFIHALGSQNSNTANLSLPFTIDANAASSNVGYYTVAMAFTSAHNVNTGTHPSVFMSSGGNSYVTLRTHEEDGARANSSNSDFSSEDQMFVSGMYIASS